MCTIQKMFRMLATGFKSFCIISALESLNTIHPCLYTGNQHLHHASFSFCHVLLQIRKAPVAPGGSLRMGHMKSGYLIRISTFQGNPALQHPLGKFGSQWIHIADWADPGATCCRVRKCFFWPSILVKINSAYRYSKIRKKK